MKTLFSLKSRIGAILTAAALLASAMPMTGFAAPTNLLTNGSFDETYTLETALEFSDGTDTDTIAVGTVLPTGWDISVVTDLVAANDLKIMGGNKFVQFIGGGYNVSQMVNSGIVPGTQYTLAFDSYIVGRGLATITWYTYDEAKDEYTQLSEESYITMQSISAGTYGSFKRYYYNTVAPSYANAAKITFGKHTGSTGPTQESSVEAVSFYANNGGELVNDGDMENVYNNIRLFTWGTRITKDNVASGNYAIGLNAQNLTDMCQNVKLIPDNYYKLSYKYAQTGRQAGADLSPYILLEYLNAPNGEAIDTIITEAATNDGVYNEGAAYFYAPAVDGDAYKAITAKLTLGTRNEADWAGSVFFDDVSIKAITVAEIPVDAKVNLIKNGGFEERYQLTADKVYTNSAGETVTHSAGAYYPKHWDIELTTDDGNLIDNSSRPSTVECRTPGSASTDDQMQFIGHSFKVSQYVKGLEAGQPYNLSFDTDLNQLRAQVDVKYMYYDAANDTYTDLAAYAAANGKTLINGRLNDSNANASITNTWTKRFGTGIKSFNFTLPPYANAVKVELSALGLGNGNVVRFDDVKLVKTNEYVPNTDMDAMSANFVDQWLYAKPTTTAAPATANNPALVISGYNASSQYPHTHLLVESGKVYKLSFKYAYENIAEGINTAPYVQIAPKNYPTSDTFNLFVTCNEKTHTEGQWTEYTAYFQVPEMANYSDGIVNISILMRPYAAPEGVEWTGNLYYDDISVQKVTSGTKIGFTGSEIARYGMQEFVADNASEGAANASILYVQDTDNLARTFYAARYNKTTNELVDAQMLTVGADLKAGDAVVKNIAFGSFDGEESGVYYKVYLWDGEMTPVLESERYN
ncbi:MAG: hypothetical protein UIM24_03890 [Clostridia bacterium]|nr:hypothetical protein [Clostridia bacterium]